MLLAIDIGNTNTVVGLFDGDMLVNDYRFESSKSKTVDEYWVLLRSLLEISGVAPSQVNASILASVVPDLTETLSRATQRAFGHRPMEVGPGIRTGMPVLYENPKEVGADRIVNAVAAFEQYQQALIVVDFGTATTFDCISARGEYMGGVIAPGLHIAAEALFSRAAKLSRVPIQKPSKIIGRTTVASIQSGIIYGYVGLVDGLVERIRTEMEPDTKVIATGGLASTVAQDSRYISEVLPNLTLDGLRIIYDRNRSE